MMARFIYIFLVFMVEMTALFALDLEENVSDFVLETKRLFIPEFPHAYNPSIIRWKEGYLMTFRTTPNLKSRFESHIYLIELDQEFNPVGKPQFLVTNADCPQVAPRTEDPRLLYINDQLWMVYSDNKDHKITRGGFRVHLAKLKQVEGVFVLEEIQGLYTFPQSSPQVREKNWTPFEFQDQLYLAYSLSPHVILKPDLRDFSAEFYCKSASVIEWKYGELRGGTPGLKIGEEYLSFFHSSIDLATIHSQSKCVSHYFMGAYTFSAEPPFEITRISPAPIIAKGFYEGESYAPYWKPVKAIFPCGFVQDEKTVWVSYGRDDHEIWLVKLDKAKLLQSLVPVKAYADADKF